MTTPPPQAAAPPTPDEMRLAEDVAREWYGGTDEAFADAHYVSVTLVNAIAAALSTTAARYREALEAATGYMLNAKIDLETGEPKRVAIATLEGGLKVVLAAINGESNGD